MNTAAREHEQNRAGARGRFALLALAVVSLIAGAWAGLSRMGVPMPAPNAETIAAHGGLMVSGVLGTLIGVERAVALDRRWAFAAPLASGVGSFFALAGSDYRLVTGAFAIGSGLFVLVNLAVTLRQVATHAIVMLLGAVAWAAGNLGWALGLPVARVVLLWVAFLVLTIGGERLELSRMLAPPPSAVRVLGAVVLVLGAGSALAVWHPEIGGRIVGASLVALVAWLLRYDLARRTVRLSGLPRYAASSILLGYFWLALAGGMLAGMSPLDQGLIYDATLHALFLGFVFSMVFGHAPIILPAVLRITLPYARLLYLPLALLHGSVALRVLADGMGLDGLRRWAGSANVATLISFALTIVFVKIRTRERPEPMPARKARTV